jgi:predicted dehydrogenase
VTGEATTQRVGIIGANFGRRYGRAFNADGTSEVVAVCARTEQSAADAAAELGGRPYTDIDEMLAAESPAVVVIAAPNALHAPLALAALEAGADVLCEKPLALDAQQAREMTERATRLGRRTFVPFTWRFLPGCVEIKRLIESGVLGTPYHVDARYFTRGFGAIEGPMRWQYDAVQAGSGALANLGSHLVHLLHWWFGDIKQVSALSRTVIPEREDSSGVRARVTVDDVFAVLAEFDDGTPATFEVGWVSHIARVGLDVGIHGSRGSAWLRFATGEGSAETGRVTVCTSEQAAPRAVSVPVDPADDWSDMSQGCVNHMVREFTEARRDGREATPNFADGLRVQCVLDAVLGSARERRWTRVDYAGPAGGRLPEVTGERAGIAS